MRWISLLLLFLLVGCDLISRPTPVPDLPTRLYQHIGTTVAAYEDADALWQAVLDGEIAVSCTRQMSVPPFFDLTEVEAVTHPPSVAIRDHLNQAILLLAEIDTIWQIECQQDSPTISITAIRQVESLLAETLAALYEADAAWAAWQS